MNTTAGQPADNAEPLEPDTAALHETADDAAYVRLPVDPAEPMASWLAII